jgi:hypothetical protein
MKKVRVYTKNDKNLLLIELHNGRCPVCKTNIVEEFEDEQFIWGFDKRGKNMYICRNCGVVARKYVNYNRF